MTEPLECLRAADEALTGIEPDELDPDQHRVLRDVMASLHVLHDSVERSRDTTAERDNPPIGSRLVTDGGEEVDR